MPRSLLASCALCSGLLLLPLSCASTAPPAPAAQAPVNAKAATIQAFQKRVDEYVSLHRKLEDTLPHLPTQTTPQQIDVHERALAKLIQAERQGAKQGDIFFPEMQQFVRDILKPVFEGKSGQQIRSEILDNEYKGSVTLAVNGRYPDDVPVSTVPPQVLGSLPKLPEELEYRFVRQNLILFDPHAHIIPDWVPRAFK